MNDILSEIKKNGATFTPNRLADYLSKKILSTIDPSLSSFTVLDPACGDGSLLSAICKLGGAKITSLIGYDTNEEYLKDARLSMQTIDFENKSNFICKDFLTVYPNVTNLYMDNIKNEFADIVIANPPYVRTQVLGTTKAKQLARDFNLTGRVDLYYPFFMAMTNALKKGGILGVITSNRYISTKSGSDIRKYLLDNYEIIEIIDLGDTKLFDAAVLPAIFIGKKKETRTLTPKVGKYMSIYETDKGDKNKIESSLNDIYNVLESDKPGNYLVNERKYTLRIGLLKHPADKKGIWQMSDDKENKWIEAIDAHTAFRIKDKFKVRVGIKSCADNVFISQLWDKEGCKIEEELLCPMISQENIEEWTIDKDSMLHVLYPHYSKNGKRQVFDIEKFPSAFHYLQKHREQLEGRNYLMKAGRKWYEYWVPQNPDYWKMPKVVFPDISVRPRFCFDESGAIVNGNCYWMCAQNEGERSLLLLIEGVSNSSVMIKYHDLCFNNKLYSGRRRYLAQYIEQYPIPSPELESSKQIMALVEKLNNSSDACEKESLASEIDNLVKISFGVTDCQDT